MNKELLMLYGARYAVVKMISSGSSCFVKRLEDGTSEIVEWDAIYGCLTEMINKLESEEQK